MREQGRGNHEKGRHRAFHQGESSQSSMRAIDVGQETGAVTPEMQPLPKRVRGASHHQPLFINPEETDSAKPYYGYRVDTSSSLQDLMRARGIDLGAARIRREKEEIGCVVRAAEHAFGAEATLEETSIRLQTIHTFSLRIKTGAMSNEEVIMADREAILQFYDDLRTSKKLLGQNMRNYSLIVADLRSAEIPQVINGGRDRKVILREISSDNTRAHVMHAGYTPQLGIISLSDNNKQRHLDPDGYYTCYIFDRRAPDSRDEFTLLPPAGNRHFPTRSGSENGLIAGSEKSLSRHIFTDLQAPVLPKETIELLKMHDSREFRTERQKFFWNMLANYLPDRYHPPQKGPATVLVPACGNFEEAPVLEALIGCGDFGSIHENVNVIGVDSDPYAIGKAIEINGRIDPETGIPHLPLNYSIIHGNAADLDHTPGVPDKANVVLLRHPNLGLAPFFWPQIFEQSVKRLEEDSVMIVTTYYHNENKRAQQLLTDLGCEIELNERNPFAKPLRFPTQIDDNYVLIARKKKE